MKRVIRSAVAIAFSLGGLVVFSGSAQAAGDCTIGFVCGYADVSYGGTSYGTERLSTRWTSLRNEASSASANGASCKQSNFYATASVLNGALSDYAFTLNSRTAVGTSYRDPNLSNGAGGSSKNWNDTIEGTNFTGC